MTWLWLNVVGFQVAVEWQLAQLVAPTGTCVAVLPVALLPLWQLAQLVAAVKVPWSTLAEAQLAVDLWQFSHTVWPLWIGVLGLPAAGGKLPVWQLPHWLPTVTEAWNRAGVHDANPPLWQLSQLPIATPASVWYGMWLARRPSAGAKPPLWQLEHWLATTTCVWLNRVGFQAPPVRGVLYPYANGWFLACNKSARVDIGGFDVMYGKFDYEDCDISTTAITKGYILKCLTKSKFKHLGGQTVV